MRYPFTAALGFAGAFFVIGFVIGASALQPSAAEEPAETHVCLVKTERSGGRMGVVVLPEDAARFEQAGFQRAQCPASLDSAKDGIGARCARLRALDAEGKRMIREAFGLSVEELCAANDAWAQSRAGE